MKDVQAIQYWPEMDFPANPMGRMPSTFVCSKFRVSKGVCTSVPLPATDFIDYYSFPIPLSQGLWLRTIVTASFRNYKNANHLICRGLTIPTRNGQRRSANC
jgi:hypothetical protein